MKKKYRVKSDADFQRVYHQGASKANRQLVLYVYPKPGQDHFRVGLSVGKRLGNAVQRNYIKRQLRQAVLELSDWIPKEIDFLLIARQDIRNKDFQQIKASLIHVMQLMDLINLDDMKL